MTSSPAFNACVPVLARYLMSLERIVSAVDAMPLGESQTVLHARLAPDMLSFSQQVETAAHFALRTAFPLAGEPVPPYIQAEPTVAGLIGTVRAAQDKLAALNPAQFVAAQTLTVCEKAGAANIELPGDRFLHEFALPNFFFHLSMAYAIARSYGCAIGKAEFDGFHVYNTQV